MDINVLKSPLFFSVVGGMVLMTNVITYNVAAPSEGYCSAKIESAVEEIRKEMAKDRADIERALTPNTGLNENRGGGLNMGGTMR